MEKLTKVLALLVFIIFACGLLWAGRAPVTSQTAGNSGTISGTVSDPAGAVVGAATVEIRNPVSGYNQTTQTDSSGNFSFKNVPFNPYHMTVTAAAFAPYVQDVDVRTAVPVKLEIKLQLAATTTSVTVQGEAGDLLETDSTTHTDVDRSIIDKLPLESASSSVSALVTQTSPGVAADSNGLFHGLGEHADNSFSVDGQPITDQQSKVFSNQIPLGAIQSLQVIAGAPPAEYGDKTSLVIDVTTRSGQGVTTPHGSATVSYGNFGTSNASADLAYGGQKWGNYISLDGLNTGRFLDAPEFQVTHDKGNEENLFDRVDRQLSTAGSLHLNLGYTRSWFQNPNSQDAQDATAWYGFSRGNVLMDTSDNGIAPTTAAGCTNIWCGKAVTPADQRSQIQTYNIAPSWNRLLSSSAVLTLGAFFRRDNYNYYSSGDPFADLGAPSSQRESVGQGRMLENAGVRSDVTYVRGIHNFKAGATYQQTFLDEHDRFGIVDPTVNAPCLDSAGNAVQGFSDPTQCAGAGDQANTPANPKATGSALYPFFNTVLLPYDLTRGGAYYPFNGHSDVKELSLYLEDMINTGKWSFNLGIRGDMYNGLTIARQAEPRIGLAYNVKQSNTVLRLSYARSLETPFNENLILSSTGCNFSVIAAIIPCVTTPLSPAYRNEFHAGFQQAFGRYLMVDAEYIWKYDHNAYDFSDFGNTPIFFPIEWHNSKIPGFAIRVSMPNFHGLTAEANLSSVSARFFGPQVGGLGTTPILPGTGFTPFRIDHDERFEQTAHFQYQPKKNWPWLGFNWRYDGGLVAGASPCFGLGASNDCPGSALVGGVPNVSMVVANSGGVPMSADQEFQAGFTCNGAHGTPFVPLPFNCPAAQFGSTLISVPAPNTENDDLHPPRIAPRNLFDLAIGDDNLFRGDRYRWSLKLEAINLMNTAALYNFLSTFSGTHCVTPRSLTAELGFHF